MADIRKEYEKQIGKIEKDVEELSKREKYLPLLRFVSFVSGVILIYSYLIHNDITLIFLAVSSILVFVGSSWLDFVLKRRIERANHLIQVCKNEIKAIEGDFSPFEPGDEFKDPDHSYSFDLDLFGNNSLFQCINRSVTIFGKNRLAEYFINAHCFSNKIIERQRAIAELSDERDFRQQMQLVFYHQKCGEKDRYELTGWLQSEEDFLKGRSVNFLRI